MSFPKPVFLCYLLLTMNARSHIVSSNSFSHVYFRCHNRQNLFEPKKVKDYILYLLAKYKEKYQINIIDFIIMDNHIHLAVKVKNAECLGNFMRTVNSLTARFINSYFKRDSQAIRERYKSPIISREKYLLNVIQYIWLNRYKVTGQDPRYDCYCSASWRLNPELAESFGETEEEKELFRNLLSSYSILPTPPTSSTVKFVTDLLNAAFSKILELCDSIYENTHTIGDAVAVSYRSMWLQAFRREHVPWTAVFAD